MKAALAFLIVICSGTAALAQSAGTTLAMTCQQAAGIVRAQGAVVLRTSPTTYDRYVNGPGFCTRDQVTEPAWVGTADAAQCFIGYRCRQSELDTGQ